MRIVSVVPSMARDTGGTATYIAGATLALTTLGVEQTVYCTDAAQPASSRRAFRRLTADDLPEGASDVDIRVSRTRRPYSFAFSPSLFAALGPAVAACDVVAIHSLNLFPQFAAYWHATRLGKPYVVTPHGALDPWLAANSPMAKRAAGALWQTRMLNRAAALHFTAEPESDLAPDVAPGAPRYVVPSGVNLARFRNPSGGEAFRREHLRGHRGPIVLFTGRLARKKGLDVTIQAFARAPKQRGARLVIVGPDDEGLTPILGRVAADCGVADSVDFIGPLYGDALYGAFSAATAWLLTSHTENFGIAVLEAMSAGLPVVISREVNISPEVERSAAGIVSSLEIDDVAGNLARLLGDPELRRGLAERGAAFAEQFEWRRVAPRLLDMYRQCTIASPRTADRLS